MRSPYLSALILLSLSLSPVLDSLNARSKFSRPLGLGRFVEAVKQVGGALRLVHIGTRLKVEHASTLRKCLVNEGHIEVMDMTLERPYSQLGIEVSTLPFLTNDDTADISQVGRSMGRAMRAS